MIEISLTATEVLLGAMAGVIRQIKRHFEGVEHRHGFDKTKGGAWENDIIGALAERVFHKWSGRYFEPRLDYKRGDAGPYEIRGTSVDEGHWLMHRDDGDNVREILIVGQIAQWRICGWVMGKDGKNEQYWRTVKGRHAYWIPQPALNSMHQLPEMTEGGRGKGKKVSNLRPV